jgi:flagellar FliL protein
MSNAKPAADGAKKGKGKLLIILVAVLVLALGGGAAAYFFMGRGEETKKSAKKSAKADEHGDEHGEEAEEGEDEEEAEEESGEDHGPAVVPLPTFTVNLADPDASRYLRTTLSLVIKNKAKAEALVGGGEHKAEGENVKIAMARSAVLELLTTKTSQELTTAEGKQALKKEIAEKATKAFKVKVSDVLFAEFVVQ